MYFNTLEALHNHDISDKGRYFCTPEGLLSGGVIVEQRTRATMDGQANLLRKWNVATTVIQCCWRKRVALQRCWHLRYEKYRSFLEHYFIRHFLLIALQQKRCARIIQRRVKRYQYCCRRHDWAVSVLQSSMHLFLFRNRRYRAAEQIAVWYTISMYRRSVFKGLFRLCEMLRKTKLDSNSTLAGELYKKVSRRHRDVRQAAYFQLKPEAVLMHQMIEHRKYEIQCTKQSTYQKQRKQHSRKKSLPIIKNQFDKRIMIKVTSFQPQRHQVPLASNEAMALSSTRRVPSNTLKYILPTVHAAWIEE